VIQIAVAVGTALLVYELGRRFVSKRVGLVAAVVATLNPYLVWHDVHENREILDQFLAVAVVLLVMILAGRRSLWLATVLGLALGLAILGNTRLLFLPLIGCAFLVGRERRTWAVVGVVLAGCALTLLPWAVRNRVQVGCFTLTTDTRALWKANNVNTYETLAAGKWIDDVPPLPNEQPTPEFAGAYYKVYGKVLPVDECARMRVYRHLVLEFWRQHPGEKAKLAGQATEMLWNPQAIRTEGRAESGRAVDKLRRWVQPAYSIPLFVLGLLGVWLLPGRLALFGVAVLTYQTLVAIGFAGATRYRVPWDFLIALAGAATVWWEVDRARRRRTVA
jgi:4-amino-4-deoxy-L-arabinose transferase-like glycosyltransferase